MYMRYKPFTSPYMHHSYVSTWSGHQIGGGGLQNGKGGGKQVITPSKREAENVSTMLMGEGGGHKVWR